AEAHLAACAECVAAMGALRADLHTLSAALARADVTPPTAAARMSFRRRSASVESRWTGEARRALVRAAVLVLALGGVAAATTPPVRRWVAETVNQPPTPTVRAPAPRRAPPAPPEAPAVAGVSILPDDGAARVVLNGAARGLVVRTRLAAGDHVEVSAIGAASAARFRTSPGRIEVVGAGPGEIHISLPRGARAAAVEVNGRVFVAKEGGRLRVLGPAATSADVETVFRVDG
ncbi:MAG TPA: hypothetical protein VE913_06230, partial [Longimicrobium sp.]|nr:hypothetical protein [Longimicrobium sp.]